MTDVEQDIASSDYLVIPVDSHVAEVAGRYRPQKFADYFGIKSRRETQIIGVGDKLRINIWEADSQGLFSTVEGKSTAIGSVVDQSGRIFVPYAGRIQASGRSVESVRTIIQNALVGKAIEPQVQVTVEGNQTNSAVIVGDVGKPGTYPISLAGTRLLELVANAGGSRAKTFETMVTLKRGNRQAATLLQDLFDVPENNVLLVKGDNVLLTQKARSFTAFGAVTKTTIKEFPTQTVSLAEALAMSGGLNDRSADPRGVYLFRFEDADVVRKFRNVKSGELLTDAFQVPVVYKLNLRDPKAWFLARYFEMRDKDMLYVANHNTAEFGKFLQIIQPLLSSARATQLIAETAGN
ncbi:polysaccharide biosynthesis/export family protein [Breoghania sp. L-A4]|uniref:polysaccharide biosynthesis/export family protein n=1 Tax=Breoghania sp. L-A4 TaxID=2304600 RepID=UPI0020BEF078|nr:polysaccharide biosynthesis/export family protein [Breoghania sp. L-A4]